MPEMWAASTHPKQYRGDAYGLSYLWEQVLF